MKYHIHIPKLLEFTLNVVCDDVTLHGKNCLITPIPYPLYLRCIMTYADKYYARRYSIFRFCRDIRQCAFGSNGIGRLYPNVLDHVVLDDDDVDAELIKEVALSPLFDDAVASIHRFASRCLAADKSEMMENAMSQVLMADYTFSKPIINVLLFYGGKLDPNADDYFNKACHFGMNVNIVQWIENRHHEIDPDDVKRAIASGNCDTIKLVFGAYRESFDLGYISLCNATVQSMELCMSLSIMQREKHYEFWNIPSLSVLQWILDHDVMEHDDVLNDIARNACRYSGHYFDMLRYLIEQRNFTVPRDTLIRIEREDIMQNPVHISDLDVFDYLALHGADVNAVDEFGRNVLERFPMLIRYWIDKGFVVQSDDVDTLVECIYYGMTVPVLEMMIDKYELNVNAADIYGHAALHTACHMKDYEVVEMLIKHGADVNKRDSTCNRRTPYDVTDDDRIKQLLISFGYKPNQ